MKPNIEMRDEWAAPPIDTNRPAGFIDRAASLPHMMLPLVSLILGAAFLFGFVKWFHGNVADPQFSFIIGAVFTGLGLFDFLFWWRRLRGGR
jgi:hypothetical protein